MTVVAIDFGTSNTVVSYLDPVTQRPQTMRFEGISRFFSYGASAQDLVHVVPSVVFVGRDRLLCGAAALGNRHQKDRFFHGFKRELAADYQAMPREIDGKAYGAAEVAEQFLGQLWKQVQQQFKGKPQPEQVVLSVPVGAFERYLDWFLETSARLKMPQVQFVDESTAAALGYAVERPGAMVLVVDFGGGTLDLSLVRTAPNQAGQSVLRADVLAKADAYIGGVDIDSWIVEHCLKRIGASRASVGEGGWQKLLEVAERLKIQLSSAEEGKESWFDDENFVAYDFALTRVEFEELLEARQLLEYVRQAMDELLLVAQSKGIAKTKIDQVLLVGGSCLIPAVQNLVVSYFGRQRVGLDKPFEAIAHGALAVGRRVMVEDYLQHGYAIRLWDPYAKSHLYYPIIPQGVKYPYRRPDVLTLQAAVDGQNQIELDIGEIAEQVHTEVVFDAQGRMMSGNLNQQSVFRVLAKGGEKVCVAHIEPPGRMGVDRVAVEFEVDERRILRATVRDLLTNRLVVKRQEVVKLK